MLAHAGEALHDTRLMIAMTSGNITALNQRLRKTVDALPPRARRKDGDDRPTPLVPRASFTEEADDEEHEHEGA